MGKLSSIQRQLQNTIESSIKKSEKVYISLAAKPFHLTSKMHTLHDESVANLADKLHDLNKQIGRLSIKLISKIEKEETKTERAKRVINNAAKKTRKAASEQTKSAKSSAKVIAGKMEKTLE